MRLSSAASQSEVAAARAARTKKGEVAAVALGGAEGGEIGEAERDERAGDGEHDVERLGVERVAGGAVEAVGEVVDEDDLAGKRALDAVAHLRRLLKARARASGQRGRVDLRLHLPLRPALRAGDGRRAADELIDGRAARPWPRRSRTAGSRCRPAAGPEPGRAAG